MLKKLSYNQRVLVTYAIFCLVAIALSCIGLIFNEWVIICSVATCSVFGFINAFFLLKSSTKSAFESGKSTFLLFTLLRYVLLACGILLSALYVYLTNEGPDDKYRYLFVIVGAIPFFLTSFAIMINKFDEVDNV